MTLKCIICPLPHGVNFFFFWVFSVTLSVNKFYVSFYSFVHSTPFFIALYVLISPISAASLGPKLHKFFVETKYSIIIASLCAVKIVCFSIKLRYMETFLFWTAKLWLITMSLSESKFTFAALTNTRVSRVLEEFPSLHLKRLTWRKFVCVFFECKFAFNPDEHLLIYISVVLVAKLEQLPRKPVFIIIHLYVAMSYRYDYRKCLLF